jgi:amino acid transporter
MNLLNKIFKKKEYSSFVNELTNSEKKELDYYMCNFDPSFILEKKQCEKKENANIISDTEKSYVIIAFTFCSILIINLLVYLSINISLSYNQFTPIIGICTGVIIISIIVLCFLSPLKYIENEEIQSNTSKISIFIHIIFIFISVFIGIYNI